MSKDSRSPAIGRPGPVLRGADGKFQKGTGQPPARRRGAPRGNLNGVQFPWRAFWARRALRNEDKWVRRVVAEHADSLLSDKPDASEAEKHVVEIASMGRGCQCLILDALRRAGGVETDKGLTLLRELRGFLSLEDKALRALGLERRAKPVPSVGEWIEAQSQGNPPVPSVCEASEE